MATAARLRPSLLPQCPACARRLLDLGLQGLRHQVRGKKKLAKGRTDTITVQLLRDVTAFGRKGAFVPVSPGQMRNDWFPKQIATYVPQTQLRQFKLQDTSFERNRAFMSEVDRKRQQQQQQPPSDLKGPIIPVAEPAPAPIKLEQLSPRRATELLDIFVPPRLDFYRQAIEPEPAKEQPQQQYVSPAAAIMAAAAAKARARTSAKPATNIYGSVSTSDVAASIAAALRENDEAARVVVADSDVKFNGLADADDQTRLKQLGEFEVEIQLRGADEAVKRVVRVLPLEGA